VRYLAHRGGISRNRLYQSLVDRMSWWPLAWFSGTICQPGAQPNVAYVLWHYPILSETFIQREIKAVRHAGIAIQIVAEAPEEPTISALKSVEGGVTYLASIDKTARRRLAWTFFYRRPLRFLNLLLYILFHRYANYKTIRNDLDLMLKSCHLAAILKEQSINHVHAPWADTQAFIAMIAARLLNLSYSVHVRASELHANSFSFAIPEKLLNASFVVTNSLFNAQHLRPILAERAAERLHIIYNGLDLAQFNPSEHRKSDAITILAVGRLVEAKGFPVLLKACQIIRDRGIRFHCEIIGGQQEERDANTYLVLKKLHRSLKLEDHVRFLGPQPFDRVLEAYNNADVFALPCVIAASGSRDITPNSLLEAMAMRLAAVSTPSGAIPEIIDDGVNGLLIPSNDEGALADALIILAQDPVLRQRLGRAAREKIQSRFDIARNMDHYATLFRNNV